MNVFGKILTVSRVLEAYKATGLTPTLGTYHTLDKGGCALTAVARHEEGIFTAASLTSEHVSWGERDSFIGGFDSVGWSPSYRDYPAWKLGRECRLATGAVHA